MSDPLKPEDYQALYGMLTSEDEGQRKQGQSLSAKLTPAEAEQFFNAQKGMGGSDKTRADNSIAGLPPEIAAVSGLSLGRAVAGEGLSLGGRAVAGVKNLAAQATPVVKYEVVHRSLRAMGVPDSMAMAIGYLASGYRMKPSEAGMSKMPPAEAKSMDWGVEFDPAAKGYTSSPQAAVEATAAPAMAKPVAPPEVAPVAPPATDMAGQPSAVSPSAVAERAAAKVSPQQLRNELGIAARKAKVTLTAADDSAVLTAVSRGVDPTEAIAAVVQSKVDPAAALAARLGTPSDAEAQAQMAMRNYKNSKYRIPTPSK